MHGVRHTTALVSLETIYPHLIARFKEDLTGWEIVAEEQSIGKSGRPVRTIFMLQVEHESNKFPNHIGLPCAGGIVLRGVGLIPWTHANGPDTPPEKVFSCPECKSSRIMRFCPVGSTIVHSCQVCSWTDQVR